MTIIAKLNNKKSCLMLYKVIISVFLLTICSIFILHFFIHTKILNTKAYDIEKSTAILTNAMELSKNSPSLNQYYKNEFFDGTNIISNEDNKLTTIYKYYDKNWNTIYKQQNINYFDDNVKYILCLNISEMNSNTNKAILSFTKDDLSSTTYGNSTGLNYKLSGSTYYANNTNEPIITLETINYFGNNIK